MPSTIAQPSPYRLANHVRACRIDEQVVLLDMQRNKYLGIGGAQLTALSQVITDWPAAPSDWKGTMSNADTDTVLKNLLNQQMLADPAAAAEPSAILEDPRHSFNAELGSSRPPSSWKDTLDIAQAASVVAFWLKWRCLADIASSVARLRPHTKCGGGPVAADELRAAASAYMRLRPFLFTAHDQCLRDSLTLIRFLACKGVFPTWVIGVRTRPFAAHSWVQLGGLVLNDTHEHVLEYTPILIV